MIHVEREGKGERCVFIHGAGGSGLSWFFQKPLSESMEVIFLDLPGHGQSSGPTPDRIEDFMDAVYGSLISANVDSCFVVGHSMGGAIAMTLALAHSEIVKGLVLAGTGAKLKVLPEFLEGMLKDKERTLRAIIDAAFGREADSAMKENGLKEMMKCDALTLYNDYTACDRFDAMGMVENIAVPALMLCGRSDLLTPPRYSEYLYHKIKGSDIGLIEGAGHIVMIEKPGEFNAAVVNFVRLHSEA